MANLHHACQGRGTHPYLLFQWMTKAQQIATLGISHEGLTLTTWNENGYGAEEGQPQGLPLRWIVGAYFRSNRSCRLSPTPPIMKMAGRFANRPYGRLAVGYFQRNDKGWARNDRKMGLDRSWKSVLPTPR